MAADDDDIWLMPGPEADFSRSPSSSSARPARTRNRDQDVHLGDHLAGRFEIQRKLGQGGMATVYEAHDALRNEPVAVKLLIPSLLSDPEAVRQFRSEAAIATRLSHPNIVTVYDFHAVDDSYAIVMESLVGKTLRDFIFERQGSGKRFSPAEVQDILAPLCEALSYAHRFTIHRDVKPENIWISAEGSIKLMDFGLAKLVRRGADPLSLVTLTQLRLGSPYYMAPEQLHEAERATAASDQFAVGVIAYEMLSGELPIGLAQPLRDLRPDLPYQLTKTVDRALSNDPADRFPSIKQFYEAFRDGADSRVRLRQHLETRPKLRRALMLAGASALLCAFIIGTLTLLDRRHERRLAAARTAQNQLLDAGSQIETVRLTIAEVSEAKAQAAATLARLQTTNPNDPPARFQEEISRAKIEREAAIAETTWHWLSLRLDDKGLPLDVSQQLAALERAVSEDQFDAAASAHTALLDEIARESRTISSLQALAASQHRLRALTTGTESSSLHLVIDSSGWQPEEDDWAAALASSVNAEGEVRASLQARFDQIAAVHAGAQKRWADLFPKLGPPPLEFIGHPKAHAEAARHWAALNRFDRAIPLLEAAGDTISGWADEVAALRHRCAEPWARARAEGRAFENILGMRFIRIESHYWSVWETRLMDFARFAAAKDGEIDVGTFWKDPGFPLSPTQPVVGIRQDVAQDFAAWIPDHFRGEPGDQAEHIVPGQRHFESLLSNDPRWQKMDRQWAILPNPRELITRSYFDEYRDQTIDAAKFIKPVATAPPAANGLYDLFGNVWEWAHDFRAIEREELDGGTYHVLYGGGSFGEVSHHGFRPPPRTRLVGRPDALGFRIVITARDLDEALERGRESP